MKRLTYKTVGDATRSSHFCAVPGVKKDALVKALGEYEELGLAPGEIAEMRDSSAQKISRWDFNGESFTCLNCCYKSPGAYPHCPHCGVMMRHDNYS